MSTNANQHLPYDPEKETYLNNFYCKFPEGPDSKRPDGLARLSCQIIWEVSFRDYYRKKIGGTWLKDEKQYEDYVRKFSARYLSESPRQFFATIDQVATDLGLDMANLQRMMRSCKQPDSTLDMCIERDNFIRPVYIRLREMGYNKAELWG